MKKENLQKTKSTNDRLLMFAFMIYVAILNTLGIVSPNLGAQLATKIFLTTRRGRRSTVEKQMLARATRQEIRQGKHQVVFYQWGQGPTVLLVHGWNGRGTQLASMVPALLERGYSVLTFDGIGHGNSEGKQAKIFDLADGVTLGEKLAGPIHGIIAHSMGGAATTLALASGLATKRLVFISPPYNPLGWVDQFTQITKISQRIGRRMKQNFDAEYGARWRILHDTSLLQKMTQPLLVLHDRKDKQVPWTEGKDLAAAWPGAKFSTTQGLGHNRILEDPEIVQQAVEFIHRPQVLQPLTHKQGVSYEEPHSKILGKVPGPTIPEFSPDRIFS